VTHFALVKIELITKHRKSKVMEETTAWDRLPDLRCYDSGYRVLATEYGIIEGTYDEIAETCKRFSQIEREQQDQTDPYNQELSISSDEYCNGYKLCATKQRQVLEKTYYESLVRLWQQNEEITFKAFYEICDEQMCTEWNTKDEYGTDFGGYWNTLKNSNEYHNAPEWTRRKNIVELFKLPYPPRVLLETVTLGCKNRMESVQVSNFLCEWIRRKYAQLHKDEIACTLPPRVARFDTEQWNEEAFIRTGSL
jgi:hypothetical protein